MAHEHQWSQDREGKGTLHARALTEVPAQAWRHSSLGQPRSCLEAFVLTLPRPRALCPGLEPSAPDTPTTHLLTPLRPVLKGQLIREAFPSETFPTTYYPLPMETVFPRGTAGISSVSHVLSPAP